ncbi:uncharacterized protein LOC106674296 [Cimex lectularius]|uniref:Uncharacterized protein n=1 Tax=Cimex lectularius TaxID=79782 RepID=A0A8I6SB18_CIMLE|nr:uncharacterized protein LOC106674296 [Cimex lectularius]
MLKKMFQTLTISGVLMRFFVFVFMLSAVGAYPMLGGSKRYPQRAWSPLPIVYQPRATRPYASYYDPYAQEASDVVDFYYPQDPYDKYRLYQMPYYVPEQYYYDDEEEQEEEMVPYGQDWYNNGNAEANAMFLQNLIMAQMLKDSTNKGMRYPLAYHGKDDYDDGFVYGEPIREVPTKEDKDVKELKSLIGGKERRLGMENRKSKMENRWVDKRSNPMTTVAPETTTKRNKGQDEVVMLRPATPARHPSSYQQRAYKPSVYDAIKKLLIEQKNDDKRQSQPQKRSYVLSEDALVEQLGNLKKA